MAATLEADYAFDVEDLRSRTNIVNFAVVSITRQGYRLLNWIDADFNYWAVSDVSDTDLQTFKQLFEGQVLHR